MMDTNNFNRGELDVLRKVERTTEELNNQFHKMGRGVFQRYPLTFSILGTLGLTLVIYGFEGVVDDIPFFADRPVLVLALGILILIITGTLYKRLGRDLL